MPYNVGLTDDIWGIAFRYSFFMVIGDGVWWMAYHFNHN